MFLFKHDAVKTYRGVEVKVYTYLTFALGGINGDFYPPSGLPPVIIKWETSCSIETGEALKRTDVCSYRELNHSHSLY
jgi:hypothetical protein